MSDVVLAEAGSRALARRARAETARALARSPAFWVGCVVVAFWIVCAALGERIAPHDPYAVSEEVFAAPSAEHWLGTDKNGRDVLSRVLVGARDVLLIAPLATLLGIAMGTLLGLVTGFFRRADDVLSRIIEAILAIPLIVLAVVCLTAIGTSGDAAVIAVIGFVFAPIVARTVRSGVPRRAGARLRRGRPLARRARVVPDRRRGASQRHGADPRRDDDPARLRDLRRRHPLLHRLRPTAALARLGDADRRAVRLRRAGLVGCPLPGARDRVSRRRRESRQRRGPQGCRPRGQRGPRSPWPRRRIPRAWDRAPGVARRRPVGRSRRDARPRRRVGLRQVDCGPGCHPLTRLATGACREVW